jgi:lipopolysaccharide/colanic/teichoic acid biosynthesis glycosyltransferase
LFLPRHKRRCEVAPGLTGLWQVSGKNKTTFEEQIDLDLSYVERKSLWLDVKIIVLTIPAIILLIWEMKTGRGKAPVDSAAKPSTKQP